MNDDSLSLTKEAENNKKVAILFFEKAISSNACSVCQFEFINSDDHKY
jgi:hypothetical protein